MAFIDGNIFQGAVNPEGVVSAPVKEFYKNTATGDVFIKTKGASNNTGWINLTASGGGGGGAYVRQYLSTSLVNYDNANDNEWIEITDAEYTGIQNDSNSETIGTLNANLKTGTLGNFAGGAPYTFAKNELQSVNGNAKFYAFRFWVNSVQMGGVNKVKAREGNTLTTVGNTLPIIAGINKYANFVLKNPSQTFTNPYLATTISSSNSDMYYNVNISGSLGYYKPGDVDDLAGPTLNFNWGIQGIVSD